MKNELVAVAIVILIVGIFGAGYFAGGQVEVKTTPTTTQPTITVGDTFTQTQTQTSTLQPTTLSTCLPGGTITGGVDQSSPPCGCVLVDSNSDGSLYVSPDSKVGDNVCVQATLIASMQVFLTVTDSAGSVAFSVACAATGGTGGTGPVSSDTCLALWNTAEPDPQGNTVLAGTYHLVAGGSQGAVALEANFTLS